jgi:hypothetical protein
MPTPKGGHEGMLYLAPGAGESLVKITGPTDATYDPGQNFADAHGMDAAHGYDVAVKSKPSVTVNRIDDKAQTTVWKCLRLAEAGTGCPFVWYPIGESSDTDNTDHGVNGTCFVKGSSTQSLTDALKTPLTLSPSAPDWTGFGNWNPA